MAQDKIVVEILESIGGKENIKEVAHCMTRLRIKVYDSSQVNQEKLKKIKGVLGLVLKGEQYQIVIGPNVSQVYNTLNEVIGIIPEKDSKKTISEGKQNSIAKILDTIAGIFNPIVPALAGAGLIKAILALLVASKFLSADSETYIILNTISDGVFSFLPFMLAYSAAKIFKMNTYVAVAIAGAMLHPNFTNLIQQGLTKISFIGIPMSLIQYNGSVFPIVLTIWFASYIEKGVDKITPKALKIILVPALTILFAAPIALIIIGPIAQMLGNYIADGASILFERGGIFAGLIYGGIYSFMVVTGLHHGMVPVLVDGITRYGFNYISPVSGSSNMAQAGSAFGVWLKANDKDLKAVAATATISALTGVTEPAIYGVNLRLKKPFLCAAIGGAAGGGFAAYFQCKAFAMGGPSFLTLPMFIGEGGHVGLVAIAFTIAFIVSAIATYIVGFEEEVTADSHAKL
ncbi:TPA: PTS transporter subunit EIIC [Clostridioides difficile]|nr:PTS transporter subunit EIIC [Clostridioides difficile]